MLDPKAIKERDVRINFRRPTIPDWCGTVARAVETSVLWLYIYTLFVIPYDEC
jgi:hypothetical protein